MAESLMALENAATREVVDNTIDSSVGDRVGSDIGNPNVHTLWRIGGIDKDEGEVGGPSLEVVFELELELGTS
jgi:hypothetical protein